MAKARPTVITLALSLLLGLSLAGCRKGPPSHEGASFGVSADGKRLAWSTGAGGQNELWLRDEAGSCRVASGRFFESPAFDPEGRLIVGVGDGIRNRMSIEWVNPDGKRELALAMPDHSQYSPRFAADGRMAFRAAAKPRSRAFGGLQWHEYDLYVWDRKEPKPRRLSEGKFIRMTAPNWSDDGKRIAFSYLDDSGVSWLRLVDVESGKTLTETKLVNNESMPVFVGERLVIVSDREQMGRYILAFVDPDTGKIEPLTRSESYFLEPIWAGGALYALEDVTHKMRFRVTKIEPKTGSQTEVLAETAFDAAPKPR